jgi:RNA polymerase sigma-B factor
VNVADAERENTITRYRYLCTRAARKFLRDGVDRHDLEQVAAIGLIKATDRFRPELGTPFEAYAWTFVLGELMHYVRDSERILRVPRKIRELDRKAAHVERALRAELGRAPSSNEIVERLGISYEDWIEVERLRNERVPLSVDTLRASEHVQLSYTIDQQLDRMVLEASLAALTEVERRIVEEIYQHDTPVSDLAKKLGYSRRHVTRLHRGALKKLLPLGRHLTV